MSGEVLILGARGSVPVSGAAFARYGGATTCVLVRLGGDSVVLDAGSGLMCLPEAVCMASPLPLLLSHPHIDHLLGLPLCPYVMRAGARLDLYAVRRNGLDAGAQVARLLSPPLWPVGPEQLPADICFRDLPEAGEINGIRVETMEGVHPGGVTLFRLTGGGVSVVFATDCTLTDTLFPALAAFARNCDLLLCDGQYSADEWQTRSGFGHSTWGAAAELGRTCGAKQVRVIHHDPARTDEALDGAAAELTRIHPHCAFAREGERIFL